MKSLIAAILLVLLASVANAFTVGPRAGIVSKAPSTSSLFMVFGNKKSSAQKAAEKEKEAKYWQGEWVCKDCGYIYNRVRSYFVCCLMSGPFGESFVISYPISNARPWLISTRTYFLFSFS
jgi:hypothetical protein